MVYDRLVEIKSIGKIPSMEDNYYDGVIEAHNDKYFITSMTEVCYAHIIGEGRKLCPEPFECGCNCYETLYKVYRMDDTLRILLEIKASPNTLSILVSVARLYTEEMREPIGFIRER